MYCQSFASSQWDDSMFRMRATQRHEASKLKCYIHMATNKWCHQVWLLCHHCQYHHLFVCCDLTSPEWKTLCCGLYTLCKGLSGHHSHFQEGRKKNPTHKGFPSIPRLFFFPLLVPWGCSPLDFPWALSYLSNNFLSGKSTTKVLM